MAGARHRGLAERDKDGVVHMQVQEARRFYDAAPAGNRITTMADSMRAAGNLAEADAALRRLRDAFGLAYCRYEARFPAKGRQQELLLVSAAPSDDLRYAETWGDAQDRVREHCRTSVCPLVWREADPDAPAADPCDDPRHDDWPLLNVAIPLASRMGDFAALHACWIDAGAVPAHRVHEQLPELSWVALHLHEAVRQLMLREAMRPGMRLTSREAECLSWIAQGKTSWETAQILDVTEHTVIFHANNAMRKLGVNTRAAAVQRAMSLGYL